MKNINFYGINIEDYNSVELTVMFERIREEMDYHLTNTGKYPTKVHVYKGWKTMIDSKHPKSHLTMSI